MEATMPGELKAAQIAVLSNGAVAEVILAERTLPYAVRRTDAFARLFDDGTWSAWVPVAEHAEDISITPDTGQGEPAALLCILTWSPTPPGGIPANHVAHRSAFYRLTGAGIAPADLGTAKESS